MKETTKKFLIYGAVILVSIGIILGISFGIYAIVTNKPENIELYCYAIEKEPVRLYSTKGIYDFDNTVLAKPNLSSECEPKQVWTIIRHGVRYPEVIQVPDYQVKLPILQAEIMENYEKKSYSKTKKLCDLDYENLKNWKLNANISIENAYHLSEYGRKEMFIVADRLKYQYPNIFNIPYSKEDFQFLHTLTEPCVLQGFEAFFEGLFGKPFNENDQENQQNLYLKALNEINKKSPKLRTIPEPTRFTQKPVFLDMLSDLSGKLGYEIPLNWTTVKMIYDICRYEYGWHIEDISPWCALLTEQMQKILEYQEDLACYYEYGYGNELAAEMGCNQIKSLIYNFMKVANEENHPKAVVHTSHRALLETLQVALNITKDPYILTADNFETAHDRVWRTTNDSPFAAQFTVVFYSCGGQEKYVHFTMNEQSIKEINFPECNNGLCPWSSVFNQLKPIADACNLDYLINKNYNKN